MPKIVKFHEFASCDKDLPRFLRATADEAKDSTLVMRITEIIEANPTFMCDCGVPAHWFFTSRPTTVKQWIEEE